MYKYLPLLILALSVHIVYGQVVSTAEKRHYGFGYNTIYETKLFDTAEIRKRNIKTAYLIYHPSNWTTAQNVSGDTILVYYFDTTGVIQKQLFIDTTGEVTTSLLDNRGNVTRTFRVNKFGIILQDDSVRLNVEDTKKRKESYSKTKDGVDSVFTTLILEQVSSSFDTLYYIKRVKDGNGKLREDLVITSKSIARQHHMMPTKTHFMYEYDDKGRLVSKKDLVSSKMYRTSYFDETLNGLRSPYRPTQGEVYETVDATNNRLLTAEIKFKDEDGIVTLTTKEKHVIISPLEKGSQLVKLLTVIVTEEVPAVEYFEVSYR
jgi:hypothetical protein